MSAKILHFHTKHDSDALLEHDLELVALAVKEKQISCAFADYLCGEAQRRFEKRKKVSMLRASL